MQHDKALYKFKLLYFTFLLSYQTIWGGHLAIATVVLNAVEGLVWRMGSIVVITERGVILTPQ